MISEESDSDIDVENESVDMSSLRISKKEADHNYAMAGTLVDEPPDELSIEAYGHLLRDEVHSKLMEVLFETKINFQLSDFQKLSLHVLGSKRNLILISPTGSGKMLGKKSHKIFLPPYFKNWGKSHI